MKSIEKRPRQITPDGVIANLKAEIRRLFYADADFKRFAQDLQFLIQRVILWPAGWLNDRGLTVGPARYQEILLEIIRTAHRERQATHIQYVPAYLGKCVQEYFLRHGDRLYEEAKDLRPAIQAALAAAAPARRAEIDPVPALLAARSVLRQSAAKRRARSGQEPGQISLL